MAETLRRSVLTLGDRRLRILDIGGGDAADSIPLAALGHDVTVLDRAASLLARADERAATAGFGSAWRTVQGVLDDLAVSAGPGSYR